MRVLLATLILVISFQATAKLYKQSILMISDINGNRYPVSAIINEENHLRGFLFENAKTDWSKRVMRIDFTRRGSIGINFGKKKSVIRVSAQFRRNFGGEFVVKTAYNRSKVSESSELLIRQTTDSGKWGLFTRDRNDNPLKFVSKMHLTYVNRTMKNPQGIVGAIKVD